MRDAFAIRRTGFLSPAIMSYAGPGTQQAINAKR